MNRDFLGRLAVATALLAASLTTSASACSICRCGDPTFNALGRDGYAASGWRIALDWERFDKDEGDPAESVESQVENRATALAAYGFNDRFSIILRVPHSWRSLSESKAGETEETRTSGFSDPELTAQLRLWASPFRGELGRRASLTVAAGVKAPWGENDLRENGERLDEHAQPGTGSTDFFGSLAYVLLFDPRSSLFASASYRAMGENDFGYRYGDVASASVAYERKLSGRFDGVLSLDFRSAAKDSPGGGEGDDPDTGGELLYFSPRILVDLGHGLVLRGGAQIPVARDLNGHQTERTVWNFGVTYLLGR